MMKHIRNSRPLALLLSLVLSLSLALPASAGQFTDITDPEVSRAADTLYALGIVSGTGNGAFEPDGRLTRAQFCKMAIEIMGRGDEAAAQTTRTIFKDVPGKHWARGYVNLAASLVLDEETGSRLMTGDGTGNFSPDKDITYREAVTTVLRILGYGAEANRAWPQGAIQTAGELGLDKGLNVSDPAGAFSRGQAALLFCRLLVAPAKGSDQPYASNLGTLVSGSIVTATDATINGQEGWVTTTQGSYRPAGPVDASLLGQRGYALLNDAGEFITLLTDGSSSVTFTVARVQANYLHSEDGARYTLTGETPVYNYFGETATFSEARASIQPGDVVTLYLDAGQVTGLFLGGASSESGFVVAGGDPSAAMFQSLTGAVRDYTIMKNGAVISMGDIREYDVATYDPISKVLYVCDAKLTCVYENAYPSPAAPASVTAAGGNQFDVLADAIDDLSRFKPGESITLLFTYDGKVAGTCPASAAGDGALGVLTANGFELLGSRVTLRTDRATLSGLSTGILSARSTQRDRLTLRLVGSAVSGSFNKEAMTLNGLKVDPGVKVYERTNSGMIARALDELPASAAATQYHQDGAGKVDLIILSPFSGDGIQYGRIDAGTFQRTIYDEETGSSQYITGKKLTFSTPGGESQVYEVSDAIPFQSGFGSIVLGADLAGNQFISSVSLLTPISGVGPADFYTSEGVTYVRTAQGTYEVSEDALYYNAVSSYIPSSPSSWSTPSPVVVWFDSLGDCRAFSQHLTVYVDPMGQQVRAVSAE